MENVDQWIWNLSTSVLWRREGGVKNGWSGSGSCLSKFIKLCRSSKTVEQQEIHNHKVFGQAVSSAPLIDNRFVRSRSSPGKGKKIFKIFVAFGFCLFFWTVGVYLTASSVQLRELMCRTSSGMNRAFITQEKNRTLRRTKHLTGYLAKLHSHYKLLR